GSVARSAAGQPRKGGRHRVGTQVLQPVSQHHQVRDGESDRSRDVRRPHDDPRGVRGADAAFHRGGYPQAPRALREIRGRELRQGRQTRDHQAMKALLLSLLMFAGAVHAADGELKAGVFDPPRAAPDFALRGSDGAELKLSHYRGKVVALEFGFTSCEFVCPTTLATLASARKKLGDAANDFQVVFVTVDPERDS